MKKLSVLILAFALLALAGCGKTNVSAPAEESVVIEEIISGLDEAVEESAAESAPAEQSAVESVPAEESAEESATAEETGTQELPTGFEPAFRFSTTALDGTAVDESVLAGHALTMINFFEPWCPPCIAELPDLEKLYETYAPEGFQILGVFSTEEGTAEVVSDAALSYPVLRYVPEFDQFQTGYVPTTIFVDGSGRIVGETKIGSNSYAGWEAIIKGLMG